MEIFTITMLNKFDKSQIIFYLFNLMNHLTNLYTMTRKDTDILKTLL